MTEPIIFYDLPCQQGVPWSPNTWKIRFVLNYKKIPYKTHWIEYPDIEPTYKRLGIPYTSIGRKTGQPYYTVPAITDPNSPDPTTGQPNHIVDSFKIVQYLEERYPFPPLFPPHTKLLQRAVVDVVIDGMNDDFYHMIIENVHNSMNPIAQPYFRSTREAWTGKKIEDFMPASESERKEALEKGEKAFDKVHKLFEATVGRESERLFFSDEGGIIYADFCLAGMLIWFKVMGAETVWPVMKHWNEGRWDRFVTAMEGKYGQVL